MVVFSSNAGNSTNTLTGVGATGPTADFTATPTSGVWPLTVSFSDGSSGTITNWFWEFGDNTTTNSSVGNLSHTYLAFGTNTVQLTVYGPSGTNLLTRPNYIIVTNPPPVSLSIQVSGPQLQLTWTTGTLQSSGDVAGPYTNVPSAASPYLISPSLSSQFFRVQVR